MHIACITITLHHKERQSQKRHCTAIVPTTRIAAEEKNSLGCNSDI